MIKNIKGFTLIEMIVSIVIMAVLMSVVVPVSMRYFDDVENQKIINEANAIYEIAKSEMPSKNDSLAGIYQFEADGEVKDEEIKKKMVEKANGKGTLETLKYSEGDISDLTYVLDNKRATWYPDSHSFTVSDEN